MQTNVIIKPVAGIERILMRMEEVMSTTGMSRGQVYTAMRKCGFPAPIKIGPRAAAWLQVEVKTWIESRVAVRDAKAAA